MDRAEGWSFARIAHGPAYWISPDLTRELIAGEVIVAGPTSKGVVRASQLGETLLHWFHFCPDLFSGLLSLSEHHFFRMVVQKSGGRVQILPPEHLVGARFAALVAEGKPAHSLLQRCRVLDAALLYFADDLKAHRIPSARETSAHGRFKQLVEHMTDYEIINYTPLQLAELSGCSPRHFSRLFRERFGVSPRDKQIEFRLLKAQQLLATTNDKIIHVAIDSGFRNLGLFNALFKRHLGLTPSEWREKQAKVGAKRSRAVILAVLAGLVLPASGAEPGPVFTPPPPLTPVPIAAESNATHAGFSTLRPSASVSTNAASVTPTNAAALAPAKPATVAIQGYEVYGNTLLSEQIVKSNLVKYVGPAKTAEEIKAAKASLQMAYWDRGFVTVSVVFPPQTLTNGCFVRLNVIEGRLATINVVSNRFFTASNVRRTLPSLQTNTFLNNLIFQQELDRANANRDRQIYPVIGEGPEPRTSSLTLRVKDRLPLHGRVELNNNATPGTPDLRLNLAAQYNNLWQLEHQIGVQYSFSPQEFKEGSYRLWEQPMVASSSAFYRLPLSPVNGAPPARPYAVGDFGYDEVTKRFRAPAAAENSELLFYASHSSSDTGQTLISESLNPASIPTSGTLQVSDRLYNQTLTENENLGARWLHPLPTLWGIRSSLAAGLDFKKYKATSAQNREFDANFYVPSHGEVGPPFDSFPSSTTSSKQTLVNSINYLPVQVSWDGSEMDSHGNTMLNLSQSFNCASVISDPADFRAVTGSPKGDGNYYIANAGVTREEKIYHDWAIRFHTDGQWANQPLISNEQFGLGGAAGVRGYQDGQNYGDSGWRVQFEPHSPQLNLGLAGSPVPLFARVAGFVDYGQVYLVNPGPRPGTISMLGVGATLNLSLGQHFDFRTILGVPLLDVPGRQAGSVRILFGLGAQF